MPRRRTWIALVLLLCYSSLRGAEPAAEYGFGLSREQALAGALSLFDGQTTFGWLGATTVESA